MIKLIVFLRLLSLNSHAVNRAENSPQFQQSLPVNINVSIPSANEEGLNLNNTLLQKDEISTSKIEDIPGQDILLQKNPVLIPAEQTEGLEQSQLASGNLTTPRVWAYQSGQQNQHSKIHSKTFLSLKSLASKFLSRNLRQTSSSLWDGESFKGDDGKSASLLSRGPPNIIEVQNAGEVSRAIPNSNAALEHFREQLMGAFWNGKIKSLRVYHYPGGKGGDIITVDVSHSPALVEILPDLLPHERVLLESLLKSGVNQLQVVLIEGGVREQSTPDLVLDGRMAEMKTVHSLSGFPLFLNKANSQIYKHAERHGLGWGTAVLNLTDHETVPVAEVLDAIHWWQAIPAGDKIASPYRDKSPIAKYPLALDRIEVFSRHDHKVFVKKADGTFEVL